MGILSLVLLGGCLKQIVDTVESVEKVDVVKWDASFAVPLVHSTLSLKDALDQLGDVDYLKVKSDGGLSIVYSDSFETKPAPNIINLPDQIFGNALAISGSDITDLNNNGTVTVKRSFKMVYKFGSSEVDRLLFKDGGGTIKVSSDMQHEYSLKLSIPEFKKDGIAFSQTTFASFDGTEATDSSQYSFDGYNCDFTKTAQGHTEFVVDIELTINKKAGNPIDAFESVAFVFDLKDQKYQELIGFFKSVEFSNGVDTLNIDFFETVKSGSFSLADPQLKFVITNSFGIPMDVNITKFDGTSANGNLLSLTGMPSPLPIPKLDLSEFGQSKKDSFTLSGTNSNIGDYVGNMPFENVYRVEIVTNPTGIGRNWVSDKSTIGVDIDIDVPIYGTAKDFVFERDIPFSLADNADMSLEEFEQIQALLLRVYTENGFPIDVSAQLYFEDSVTSTVLDSLFGEDILILQAASLDGTGKVTEANPDATDILVENEQIKNIYDANNIRAVIKFNTSFDGTNQPDVKFFEEYKMLLQLGLQASFNINQKF